MDGIVVMRGSSGWRGAVALAALVALGAVIAGCGGSSATPTPDTSLDAPAAEARDIAVYAPSVPAPAAPGVAALYFTVRNSGPQPDRLMAVSTDASQTATVHQTVTEGSTSTMKPVEGGLEVPAHGQTTLSPGGYHVMMMQLQRDLQPGDSVRVTLTFERAGELSFTAPVTTYGGMSMPMGSATAAP